MKRLFLPVLVALLYFSAGCGSDSETTNYGPCTGDDCPLVCGDSIIATGEQCDDGNINASDGCDATCQIEVGFACTGQPSVCVASCGDGVIDAGELCDDGNTSAGDGCGPTCLPEVGFACTGEPSSCAATCGDGALDAGELCDDGNASSNDGCSASCLIEAGFGCTGEPSVCSELSVCGDGAVDGDEECDDGNTDRGDGCDSTCHTEAGFECSGAPSTCDATCGDGLLRGDEECDDGNIATGDGCDAACEVEASYACTGQPSVCQASCGNGSIDAGEQCDDGNIATGDGCGDSCAIEDGFSCDGVPSDCAVRCGDGIIGGTETCDDGNTDAGDGCSATCATETGFDCDGEPTVCLAVCGDGIVVADELCDNAAGTGDGCDDNCEVETGWRCTDGGTGTASVCSTICGDGIVLGSETCDDADTDAGDGCSDSCAIEDGFGCSGTPSRCADFDGCAGVDCGAGFLCLDTPAPAAADAHTCIADAVVRVFVSSTQYDGALGGVAGADATCQAIADGAGLGGSWSAWLSDSSGTAADRTLQSGDFRYVLVNGQVIADNWTDLTDGTLQAAINVTETGQTLTAGTRVWTNALVDGTADASSCADWTNGTSGASGSQGSIDGADSTWTTGASNTCDIPASLYCVESGVRMFMSPWGSTGNLGGLVGADARCQASAEQAGLGGEWIAWLSDSQVSLGARLTHSPFPYYRTDGVMLATDWTDLTDGSIAVTTAVDPTGTAVPSAGSRSLVMTSTNTDGTANSPNCSDWTSEANYGMAGYWLSTDANWTQHGTKPCIYIMRVLCVEQPDWARRVFVTSASYDGDLDGVQGADRKCREQANAARLGGEWAAWLSGNTSAAGRISHGTHPYRLVNGRIVALDWADLTDGALMAPIDVDQNGAVVPVGTSVWTATGGDGTAMTNRCGNWTSTGGQGGVGSTDAHDNGWTDSGTDLDCNQSARLYCVEQ